MLASGPSFTIAGGKAEGKSQPTRLRRKSGDVTDETPPPSERAAADGVEGGGEANAEEKIKKKRKETYRKISQELARSRAEASGAVRLIGDLIQHLTCSSSSSLSSVNNDDQQQQQRRGSFNDRRGSIDSIDSMSSSIAVEDSQSQYAARVSTAAAANPATDATPTTTADLLTSMMTLTKVAKRLALKRDDLEGAVARMRSLVQELEREKAELFAQLESMAKRLREEKKNSSAAVTALKIKFERRIEEAEEKAAAARLAAGFLEASNKDLSFNVERLETKLLEVPRMEEAYLRTARGMVRQKEVLVNEKEVKIRTMSAEVEQVQFWKQKSQLAQEEVARKDKEAAIRNRQLLMVAHNYRQTVRRNKELEQKLLKMTKLHAAATRHGLSSASTARPRSPSPPGTTAMGLSGRVDENDEDDGDDDDPKSLELLLEKMERAEREKAAAAAAAASKSSAGKPADSLPAVKSAGVRPATAHATTGSGSRPTETAPSQAAAAAAAAAAVISDEDFNAKEVRRLRGVIEELRAETEKLHFKLANARAYPLLNTEHSGGGGSGSDRLSHSTRFVGKVYVSEADELFDDPEGEDRDAVTVALHKEAEAKRMERAVSIQREFQNRLDQIRGKRPNTTTALAHFKKGEVVNGKTCERE